MKEVFTFNQASRNFLLSKKFTFKNFFVVQKRAIEMIGVTWAAADEKWGESWVVPGAANVDPITAAVVLTAPTVAATSVAAPAPTPPIRAPRFRLKVLVGMTSSENMTILFL